MESFDRKKHWENIYQTKELTEVSWFQPTPETSLGFIQETGVLKNDKIIDIGGGDSFLVDHLLDLGYQDISVLDISEAAIDRAKKRLGERAKLVKWLVSDITNFCPTEKYDCWHDRAAFHFLTDKKEVSKYVQIAKDNITQNGSLIIGTFSDNGPKKCSGIPIQQYTRKELEKLFSNSFQKIACKTIDHKTPFDTIQNFVFCSFKSIAQ
ncbi:class I SAM-dependent methyltransferase [Aequorivita marina]|uniref:class I SAM-dependent methyltransferase n=1 Tax=Aequorivita marina TaxID=3073654 RepID=UPI002874EC12|nr:class I SAM-dependent methyltransferase [Aequorivita sp. S2608]MDS1296892.1 class I SAM-dependent methyltransferase [Aequorivita sp. S2608]